MDEELLYYLSFSHFFGIGPIRLKALVGFFGDVKSAYRAANEEIKKVIGIKLGEKFIDFRRKFNPLKKVEEFRKKGITVLCEKDEQYPQLLKHIEDPPICLYVKGKINSFDFNKDICFAIVGTRTPTLYGEQVVKKFSADLTRAGFVIVSGMALGIDSLAHWENIKNKGRTIAVLGCGVDVVYPAVNLNLYRKIIDDSGWVISEFPPNQFVAKGLFVARNRIISGMSKGVLVIEGAKDSGTLITVRHAADQGKDVFATPAPITSAMSEAPNLIIKQGAKLVTSVEDILCEFGIKVTPKKKEDIEKALTPDEKNIFHSIINAPKLADEISAQLKYPIEKTLNILSLLEIKEVVEKNREGKYQILSNF